MKISKGALALAGMAMLAAGAVQAGDHLYVGAAKCKTCHGKPEIGDQYTAWSGTAHAKAYETLAGDKAKEYATAAGITGDPQQAPECVKCHVAGWGTPAEQHGSKYKLEDGVSCEACHGAGGDYKKKAIMVDPDESKARGLLPQSEAVCLECHNDESPAWDPTRYGSSGFDYRKAVREIAHPVPEGYDPYAEDDE